MRFLQEMPCYDMLYYAMSCQYGVQNRIAISHNPFRIAAPMSRSRDQDDDFLESSPHLLIPPRQYLPDVTFPEPESSLIVALRHAAHVKTPPTDRSNASRNQDPPRILNDWRIPERSQTDRLMRCRRGP